MILKDLQNISFERDKSLCLLAIICFWFIYWNKINDWKHFHEFLKGQYVWKNVAEEIIEAINRAGNKKSLLPELSDEAIEAFVESFTQEYDIISHINRDRDLLSYLMDLDLDRETSERLKQEFHKLVQNIFCPIFSEYCKSNQPKWVYYLSQVALVRLLEEIMAEKEPDFYLLAKECLASAHWP
jgi:hypothetical protein